MAQTTSRRKKKAPSRAPARRRPAARKRRRSLPRLHLPRFSELEQPALDAIGLGIVAGGLLLGFLLYTGSDGGTVGSALTDTLRFAVGAVAYSLPIFAIGAGVALAAGEHVRSTVDMQALDAFLEARGFRAVSVADAEVLRREFLQGREAQLDEGSHIVCAELTAPRDR